MPAYNDPTATARLGQALVELIDATRYADEDDDLAAAAREVLEALGVRPGDYPKDAYDAGWLVRRGESVATSGALVSVQVVR